MLKSFHLINILSERLEALIIDNSITNYLLDLTLSHKLIIYIVSNKVNTKENLFEIIDEIENLENLEIGFEFLNEEMSKSDEYSFLFEEGKTNFGYRRSLQNLISPKKKDNSDINTPVATFYSYKGGVGRTTSLILFSNYYSRLGKKVFIIDCDFEAPGLINFFNISQFDNPKNGVIEYLNDKKFDKSLNLNDEYVYEVSSTFTGEGKIHMMPAGNIFGNDKEYYLEGLARVDIQGEDILFNEFKLLIQDIEKIYSPDIILFDSRTGFNNIFGTLSQLSDIIITLAGDDLQNEPGLEFLLEQISKGNITAELCIVLSIVSSSIPRRFDSFKNKVNSFCDSYAIENELPVFCFEHERALELLGTDLEDYEEIKYFLSHNTSSYQAFFSFFEAFIGNLNKDIVAPHSIDNTIHDENYNDTRIANECGEKEDENEIDANLDKILKNLIDNFPEQYAEETTYNEAFFSESFYIRKCMQDLFLPEYKILIGGKGTGKTAFYKALQDETFFSMLIKRAEKKHLNFKIQHVVSEINSPEKEGFIDFSAYLGDDINNEGFVRKFWIIYLWASIRKGINSDIHTLYFPIKNNQETAQKFKAIIANEEDYALIEEDLSIIDNNLRKKDERLLVTFDQLDFVVKPTQWDKGISPLIRLCQSNTWERIQPKLFLRRDLFNKLGNITNKNLLAKQAVNLEWSKEEMYAFFFKVIFAYSKKEFFEVLYAKSDKHFQIRRIENKISGRNQYNQLAPDIYMLEPLIKIFFGSAQCSGQEAYNYLYDNIKNADRTVSLRPFLDLIRLAIVAQFEDNAKLRKDAILALEYCSYGNVRAEAVDTYFKDLANEAGNDLIKYFVEDIRNNKVPPELKYSSLLQGDFELLVCKVRENHTELENRSIVEFEEMLVLNGIMFITYISGGMRKFSFAYLYKYYMGLKSPKRGMGRYKWYSKSLP